MPKMHSMVAKVWNELQSGLGGRGVMTRPRADAIRMYERDAWLRVCSAERCCVRICVVMLQLHRGRSCGAAHLGDSDRKSYRVRRFHHRPYRCQRARIAAISPVCGSVTVIGAGAAGLTAAYFAAVGGAEVRL